MVERRGCTKSTFRFWPNSIFHARQLGLTYKMSKCASHPERNYFSLFPSSNSIGICINREKWDKVCTFSRQKSEMLKKSQAYLRIRINHCWSAEKMQIKSRDIHFPCLFDESKSFYDAVVHSFPFLNYISKWIIERPYYYCSYKEIYTMMNDGTE